MRSNPAPGPDQRVVDASLLLKNRSGPERASECIVKWAVTRIPERPSLHVYVSAEKGPKGQCKLPVYRGGEVGKS